MSDATWERVLTLARQVKLVFVVGFGEPLANPRCVALLRQLDEMGIWTGIATNGTLLTSALCAELVGIRHLTLINVSLDSPDATTYRAIRYGNLDLAWAGLRRLMDVIDDPTRVTVSCVLSAKSLPTLARLPPILADLGVRRLVLQSLVAYSPGMKLDNLAPGGPVRASVAALRAAAGRHGIELRLSNARRFEMEIERPLEAAHRYMLPASPGAGLTRQCGVPWEAPFIDKDGRVFPCCRASSHAEALLGDLRVSGLEEIWNGASYEEFRRGLLEGHPLPGVCASCNAVPLGIHPFRDYRGEVCEAESVLHGSPRLRLIVRNVGRRTWKPADRIHVGTAVPQDRPSAFHHSNWLSANRIGSFRQGQVAPGETAAFEFRVRPTREDRIEAFQLVLEDRFWLPNTRFDIGPVRRWAGRGTAFWGSLRALRRLCVVTPGRAAGGAALPTGQLPTATSR